MKNFKFGFTLAEVLITLGIIGIVAAMTIPTLVTYTAIQKYKTQFKKAVSMLSQAAMSGQANYDLDFAAANSACSTSNGGAESPLQVLTFCALFNSTLHSRFLGTMDQVSGYSINAINTSSSTSLFELPAYAEEDDESPSLKFDTNVNNYIGYELADGTIVAFNKNAAACNVNLNSIMSNEWISTHQQCLGFIDVNGLNLPNRIVNCNETDSDELNTTDACVVPNDRKHLTDIYPVIFHDATVIPATPAARYILNATKRTLSTDRQID